MFLKHTKKRGRNVKGFCCSLSLHTNLESKMKEEGMLRFEELSILSKTVATWRTHLQVRMPVKNLSYRESRKQSTLPKL